MCNSVVNSFPSPDAAIELWLKQLWDKLLALYPLPPGQRPISDSVLYPILCPAAAATLYASLRSCCVGGVHLPILD